jgi:DNA-binding transcriptional LysR family regulator
MPYDARLLSGVTVLMAVVEAGSMARAADALGLTSSGVGRAIGRLRVNVDPFFSRVVLAAQISKFLDRHPEVRLELIMRDRVGDLVADGFDLALRFDDPPGGSLIARKLIETRILTVASPEFVARYGRPTHPSEVEKLRCIDFYNAANAQPFEWEFRQGRTTLPVKPSAPLMVSDVGAMLSACEAGFGIAQIMALGSGHLLADGKLIELFPDWPGEVFPLYALYPSRQLRAAKVRTFIEFTCDLLVNSPSF